jgi:hypothetical protein
VRKRLNLAKAWSFVEEFTWRILAKSKIVSGELLLQD